MATFRGFPPSNTISPSVRIIEKDLSFIAPEQNFHRAGLVGFCSKGPINVPTLISTTRALHTTFGHPHPQEGDPYLIYAAEQYLLVANQLYVVRVGDEDRVSDERATVAEVDVSVAGAEIVFIGSEAGPFDIKHDSFFSWKLNGILSSKTLLVTEGNNKTAEDIVDELNSQLNSDGSDGILFYVHNNDYVAVKSTFAYGPSSSLELVSIQSALYGPVNGSEPGTHALLGLGTGMNQAKATSDVGYSDGYDSPGSWDFTGLTNLQLQVVVDGSNNASVDNYVQTIDFEDLEGQVNTTAEVVEYINDLIMAGTIPGGFYAVGGSYNSLVLDGETLDLSSHSGYSSDAITLATLHHGKDARLLIKSESTAFEIFNFKSYNFTTATSDNVAGTTAVGESPTETAGDSVKAIGNGDSVSNTLSFTLTADSSGIEGNDIQVVITNDEREGVFKFEVYVNGVNMESIGNLSKDPSSRYYIGTYLPQESNYVRVTDNTETLAPPANGTYTLSGGSDGIPSDPDAQDDLLIGSDKGTGIYALSEPEQIEIDLLAVPGHSSSAVVTEMLNVCANRLDCLAIIDPPFGLSVNEIINWQNGTHPLNSSRLDSDFGALFWPWVKIRDNHNRVDVWVPPSGSVMAVMARSDQLAAPWFAAAGVDRGIVSNILDVYNRPTLPERDDMYGNRNAINPIIQFSSNENFMIWGNKTLQRKPTALDRISVRRLMFVIQKRIRAESRSLLFTPHDDLFRDRFIDIAQRVLDAVKVGRGIADYVIQADAEINTPDVIDRNEFRARIGIQPTHNVEFIFLEFSLHRTGDFGAISDSF